MDKILEKWEEILARVKDEYDVTNTPFKTWLLPLEPYGVEGSKLYLLVPAELGQHGLNYIVKRYKFPIQATVGEVTGIDYEVELTIDEPGKATPLPKKNARGIEYTNANLKPNYTFETFVVGSSNRFAHQASLAVAESPGEAYNPLFIYGSPGLGKTHLMQSIGNYVLDQMSTKKVLYETSEIFTNDVIESLRSGNLSAMTRLRNKYRTVDVLMIDDIQFLIGREATQIEFFNIFEQLHTTGKQIVLTSDKPPKELTELNDRYRTRFGMGIVADVGYPDYETRMAILRKKAEFDRFCLDDEILNYIATNIHSNVRELEGALNTLKLFCNMEKTKITMEIAVKELQNIISPETEREITPQLVIEIVAEHFHITTDQMISKNRSKNIARPRQIAMYLCQEMTNDSVTGIGKLLSRDHSTIIHGRDLIEKEYEKNEEMRGTIDTIKKKINPN